MRPPPPPPKKNDFRDGWRTILSLFYGRKFVFFQEIFIKNLQVSFFTLRTCVVCVMGVTPLVHQLVSIPDTPFLIPARVSKGHNMNIPQSSVNSFPNLCHTSLEPAPSVSSLSTKLGGLQGPASIQLHVHVDQHQNFNLYINCF